MQRKILDTCARCRGNAPLADKPERDDEVAEIVAHIERIASERDTCRSLDLSALDADEFELLLVWDEAVAAHERAHQVRITYLFDWLVSQFQTSRK